MWKVIYQKRYYVLTIFGSKTFKCLSRAFHKPDQISLYDQSPAYRIFAVIIIFRILA